MLLVFDFQSALAEGMTGRDEDFFGDLREQGPGPFLQAAHHLITVTQFSRSWLAFSATS